MLRYVHFFGAYISASIHRSGEPIAFLGGGPLATAPLVTACVDEYHWPGVQG
jgi:hypothetical protein